MFLLILLLILCSIILTKLFSLLYYFDQRNHFAHDYFKNEEKRNTERSTFFAGMSDAEKEQEREKAIQLLQRTSELMEHEVERMRNE